MLQTPSLTSSFEMYRDESAEPPVLVCTVGKTVLHYDLRVIEDMHSMLKAHGDWMPLGNADGLRGRVGNYVTPVLEVMGLAELEHNPRNNRIRAR